TKKPAEAGGIAGGLADISPPPSTRIEPTAGPSHAERSASRKSGPRGARPGSQFPPPAVCWHPRAMSIQHRPDAGPHHPAVADDLQRNVEHVQGSIADLITRYAGSMLFVYVHIAIFAIWM